LENKLGKSFVLWARTDVNPIRTTKNATSQYNEEANYLTVLVSRSNSLRLIFLWSYQE